MTRLFLCGLALPLGLLAFPFENALGQPRHALGTWEVVRFIEVGGHGMDGTKWLHERITIGRDSLVNHGKLPFTSSTGSTPARFQYSAKRIHSVDSIDEMTLLWYDSEEAIPDSVQRLTVQVGQPKFYFEFTKDRKLTFYYDGYFFILQKVSSRL